MKDEACVAFLQEVLPRLDKRWEGFRKVRGQVCKRIGRRMAELELETLDAYRAYLAAHAEEWDRLDAMCRITISRFYRDRGVFDTLRKRVLPGLAEQVRQRGEASVRVWSAGCASGEEVYTMRLIWQHAVSQDFPNFDLVITATDAGAHMLERARRGCYPRGTLKELPDAWIATAFEHSGGDCCIRPAYRAGITWRREDIRETMPEGLFDLVLCRNLVVTYFEEALQRRCLAGIAARLHPGGVLLLGKHETLPEATPGFEDLDTHQGYYRRR